MSRTANPPAMNPPTNRPRIDREAPRPTDAGRRIVDPTSNERELAAAQREFLRAMSEYKRKSGRMFPTWSEVLEVLKGLGYEKLSQDA